MDTNQSEHKDIPLELRPTIESDLDRLFSFHIEAEAHFMAAFTEKDPKNKSKYMKKWRNLMASETVNIQSILLQGEIIGSVMAYEMDKVTHISYWIGKDYWGKGIATKATSLFLSSFPKRPIYGHAAADNIGSRKVLERCGFTFERTLRSYANARGKLIEECVYVLKS